MIAAHAPDIAFWDIRMPGMSGLEVAGRLTGGCRVVFITAYDQYAVEAFEKEAVDYILKPVTDERLAGTVERLQRRLLSAGQPAADLARSMQRLSAALAGKRAGAFLKWVKARQGEALRMIAAADIFYFKAQDKYTLVKARDGEYLIKRSIQRLAGELDPDRFWRIHRGAIVNLEHIAGVHRAFAGRLLVKFKELPETLPVSKSYAHRFKQM